MNGRCFAVCFLAFVIPSFLTLQGCGKVHAQSDAGAATAGAPPEAKVVPFPDAALFSVDHPEQFPLAAATEHPTTSELVVTGTRDARRLAQRSRRIAGLRPRRWPFKRASATPCRRASC